MASKNTIKRLNKELIDKKNHLDYLQTQEPDVFLKERDGILEELRLIKLELFKIIVEDYPKQNPIKWAAKKDRVLAKLAFLEAGGLEENFKYDPNAAKAPGPVGQTELTPKPAEPKEPEPTAEFVCETCKFVAKSNAGLIKHSNSHKE